MAAVETTKLTRRFGARAAVDGLDLNVPERSLYGLLGANGAGKTTTLRLLLGLLRPSDGSVRIFGEPVHRRGLAGVGALIEAPSLYPHLTGAENLDITRRLLGLGRSEIGRVLEIVDLAEAAGQRVGGYSLGMRQRLAIARALLGRPRLLVLDEPTNGLDPEGIRAMRALLRRLPETDGATLVISSHLLTEIEQVATHVAILRKGRLLLEQPIDSLLGGEAAVEVETGDQATSAQLLENAGFAVTVDRATGALLVGIGAGGRVDPAVVAETLVRGGASLMRLSARRSSLEAIYHERLAA